MSPGLGRGVVKTSVKGKEKAADVELKETKTASKEDDKASGKGSTSKLSTSIAPELDPRVTVAALVSGQLVVDTFRGAANIDWLCKWADCNGAFRWDPSGKWSWYPKSSPTTWGSQVELSNLRQARMKSLGISLEPRDDPNFIVNILYRE